MGGNKKQKRANAQMQRENELRQKEINRTNLASEQKARGMEYQSMYSKSLQDERLKAEQGVTAERTQGLAKHNQIKSDYATQERRRLFNAKKGVGQVGAEDYAITADMVKEADAFLSQSGDYWEAKRKAAGEDARSAAEKAFLSEHGAEADYVGQGELAKKALERGREYHGRSDAASSKISIRDKLLLNQGNTQKPWGGKSTKWDKNLMNLGSGR